MKAVQKNPDIIESSDYILNMLCVMDLSLILCSNYCVIDLFPKKVNSARKVHSYVVVNKH